MVNNVIGVVNYVIAARPSLLNFMIADIQAVPSHRSRSVTELLIASDLIPPRLAAAPRMGGW